MSFKKVVAIIRTDCLEQVEGRLQQLGIKGVSITRVKGYGELADFSRSDWFCPHARVEIYTKEPRVRQIVEAVMETAHTGTAGDGIVAVIPVEAIYRVREKREIGPSQL